MYAPNRCGLYVRSSALDVSMFRAGNYEIRFLVAHRCHHSVNGTTYTPESLAIISVRAYPVRGNKTLLSKWVFDVTFPLDLHANRMNNTAGKARWSMQANLGEFLGPLNVSFRSLPRLCCPLCL